jgi:hypothetical protein
MNNNKKGLSMIVTSLILILLVLVAIGIIWFVVKGIVDSGTEQISLDVKCLNVDVEATSVTNVGLDYTVTVERKGSNTDEIGGVMIVYKNAGGESSGPLDIAGNIKILESKTDIARTLEFTAESVDVIAYFEDGSGSQKLCSQTATYTI